MKSIIWIIDDIRIENYLVKTMLQILDEFPKIIIYLYIRKKSKDDCNFCNTRIIGNQIDRRFKTYKEDPFLLVNINSLNNHRISIVKEKHDLIFSDWVIFTKDSNADLPFYLNLSKNGLINFETNTKQLVIQILKSKAAIDIKFKISTKVEDNWIGVSNLTINQDFGILNLITKYFWYKQLAICKFLHNQEDFHLINDHQARFKFFGFKLTMHYAVLVFQLVKRKIENSDYNWKIAIKNELGNYVFLKQPKQSFWADPFIIANENGNYIFLEELNSETKLGEIACIKLNDQFEIEEKKTILKDHTHYSFPNVFLFRSQYYMIPENIANGNLNIYKAIEFPYKWQFEKTLMSNIKLIDTIWIFHDGYYWLFGNLLHEFEYDNNDSLYLFYADDLLSDHWHPHKKNPIVTSSEKARNAGNIFIKDGKLFRPSQNCSVSYGTNIFINEIQELTTENYSEITTESILPLKGYCGTHTFNTQKNFQVSDFLKKE